VAKTGKMEMTCVGLRHRVTPSTLREMAKLAPLKIQFKREPENIHDENAIAVICNERPWKGMQVGYVPRQSAAEIAPRIDAGKIVLTGGYLNTVDDESGIGEMSVAFEKIGSTKPKN
jgi:HIRAN domain